MYFLCTASIEKFCCLTELSSTHNGIINKKKFFVLDQFAHRDQLHPGDQVTLVLVGRHKGSWPGRCIFNKWSCIRDAGFIGIADGMCNTGVRNTCYNVRVNGIAVSFRKHTSTAVTHIFYVHAFVRCCWVSIINPEERTDFHFLSRFYQSFHTVCCNKNDLSGSQFLIIFISQINIGMAFKGQTIRTFFVTDLNRSSAHFVTGCIDSVFCHKK